MPALATSYESSMAGGCGVTLPNKLVTGSTVFKGGAAAAEDHGGESGLGKFVPTR